LAESRTSYIVGAADPTYAVVVQAESLRRGVVDWLRRQGFGMKYKRFEDLPVLQAAMELAE
jgi:hypothetical protein